MQCNWWPPLWSFWLAMCSVRLWAKVTHHLSNFNWMHANVDVFPGANSIAINAISNIMSKSIRSINIWNKNNHKMSLLLVTVVSSHLNSLAAVYQSHSPIWIHKCPWNWCALNTISSYGSNLITADNHKYECDTRFSCWV